MKIAIEGCAHGDLDNIYETILTLEETQNIKVDLLICCGDFQSSRNEEDLRCMAVPPKYYNICSFYKYYNGEKTAPILTIFIGGNHEASNYLQELPYGGWVAPNIYYLGYAGIVNIAGIRIGGISGIYKGRDFLKGHFEKLPYNENTKRSVYHIRNLEVFRLKQLSQPVDIFLSHDWPAGIWKHGNVDQLLRFKPHFREDIQSGELGSPPCQELLTHLKPQYWFSAHLHCKFAALVQHSQEKSTKFLALDKCLPNRRFLQIIDIPHVADSKIQLSYDLEWLTILHLTNHLLSVKNAIQYMPGSNSSERWNFTPTEEEKSAVYKKLDENLLVPNNFVKSAKGHNPDSPRKDVIRQPMSVAVNTQNTDFCALLGISDPMDMLRQSSVPRDKNEVVNLSSFADESTDTSLCDFVQTPVKRSVLQLPEPKDDKYQQIEAQETHKNEGGMESCDAGILAEFVEGNTPQPRKFRRRNADLYQHGEQ